MELEHEKQWQYDHSKSYECNMQSWIDAVYWERKKNRVTN